MYQTLDRRESTPLWRRRQAVRVRRLANLLRRFFAERRRRRMQALALQSLRDQPDWLLADIGLHREPSALKFQVSDPPPFD